MTGAIFFSSKYGSTAQYAGWIAEATGLPVFDIDRDLPDPNAHDFLVLGSPIIYYRLYFHRWLRHNLDALLARPVLLFTVSGAGPGPKLDGWLADSMPVPLLDHARHFPLKGRQTPADLNWIDRIMLQIGGLMNRNRQAGREERKGFDHMDRDSIAPLVAAIADLQTAAPGPAA